MCIVTSNVLYPAGILTQYREKQQTCGHKENQATRFSLSLSVCLLFKSCDASNDVIVRHRPEVQGYTTLPPLFCVSTRD